MNHIYRLVWNTSKHMLVAVAEIASSRSTGSLPRLRGSRKLARRTLALAIASLLSPGMALAAQVPVARSALQSVHAVAVGQTSPNATALPTGGQVVAGHATLHQSDATLGINQSTRKAIFNWQSFNIGTDATVNFVQPGSSSIALNRILGNAASQIYGHLNANGQVFLVNPNGVFFAKGAQVNVGGIVASTLGITNSDFLSGNYHFSGSSSAGITNAGSITAAKGGYVAFIGRTVDNQGRITTPTGSTALGAGSAVNLRLAGSGLISFHVSQSALKAQANNGGIIAANGGTVLLTAEAKNALLETVVNNTGVIRAQTAIDHDGTIELLGGDSGTVNVAGTLDASAPNGGAGGRIETSGQHVKIADSAAITTKATSGHDGRWTIDPNDFTIAASGGDITGSALSTALASGNVTIQTTSGAASCTGATCGTGSSGNGDIEVNDSVSWSANVLTLDAYRNIDINTAMNGSGSAGLALQYGQGATDGVIGGEIATYNVNAPVNLASGGSFHTKLGSSGANVGYTIITSLGAPGSMTQADLQGIEGRPDGNYVLGADIDAAPTGSNSAWGTPGFAPIGNNSTPFTGIFDGLGHTINDLTIRRSGSNFVGLFGVNGGTIRNVGVVDSYIAGHNDVGGLAGSNSGATIANAYAVATVSGNASVGGLVGANVNSVITNAHVDGGVSGGVGVGGLVGSNQGGTISDAYATDTVDGNNMAGGLVGHSTNGAITDAYATGSVSGSSSTGGLVGRNYNATITDAYATGSVDGSSKAGGLTGLNYNGTITDSYATGAVTGNTSVGGLVGSNYGGTVTDGYWDTTTSGQSTTGIGAGTTTGATGLTTAQLAAALPAGFDSSTWGNGADSIGNGQTTPYLLANASFGTVSGSVILGSDTSATPMAYGVILNVTQLQNINTTGLAGNYVLGTNIDASATSGWNGGQGFAPIAPAFHNPFTGIFDGLGHTINDLTVNRPSASSNIGLFGANAGTIRNVGVVGGSASGYYVVGGLVGWNEASGTIEDAYATDSVSGALYDVGGLVGLNAGTISNAYATGNVSGTNTVGGLVGLNYGGTISDAYATGDVSGDSFVGGLVGLNLDGTISDAYATGSVSGSSNVGGLVGSNSGGTVTDGYWDTTTSGQTTGIGVGTNTTGATGLTTAQMMQSSNFTGFSIDTNGSADKTVPWRIYNGDTMPLLTVFMTPMTVQTKNSSQVYNGQVQTSTGGYTVTSPTGYDASLILGTPSASTGGRNVGSYTLDSGLYSVQQGYDIVVTGGTLKITKAPLTLTGLSASNKIYDATTDATASGTLSGILGSDTVTDSLTASFDNKNVGTGKTVTVDGITLSGADAGNYKIAAGQATTADITPATLTLTGLAADNKVYDATTVADATATGVQGVIGTDSVTLDSLIAAFDNKNVGTGKTVTVDGITLSGADAGNYQIATGQTTTADITPATLTLTGLAADNKVYDATKTATASGTLSGILGSDTVTDSLTASFDNKNVGTGKTVTVDGITLSGTDAGNYQIASGQTTTADITPATLTLTGLAADNKIYDATTVADATATGVQGVIGTDSVTLDSLIAAFDNKNVGTGKTVTVDGITLSGADAGNYKIAAGQTTTADITPATLTLTGLAADNKVYDATTVADATATGVQGVIGTDSVTLDSLIAAFDNKNVGTGKTVTVDGITLSGADAGNYQIATGQTTTADISKATLTLTGLAVANKIANGTTLGTVTDDGSLAGVFSGDVVILDGSQAVANFTSAQVGTHTVDVTGLTLKGTDAGNYTLASPQVTHASIQVANGGGTGVPDATMQAGYPRAVSGPSRQLDPHAMYVLIQGPGKSPHVDFKIANGGSASINDTTNGMHRTCTSTGGFSPFTWSVGVGTCAKNDDGAGL